ncbi:hypothetical protein [Proteiniclasticum ruminis]|uniref:Uncharacterized protein n=1 Tax=Proteiniclasticum ruminis TaxID=398199 RepID=A0A1I5BPE2_9CLOT|nr:hypothetical protein [Proteiniclasticum ruminis]SFN76583.1 hypothetical protein SAMN04488695_1051 [Proteiniclasticum ruminis]
MAKAVGIGGIFIEFKREKEEVQAFYRNCARKPIPSLPGFSRGMNGACVAKHIAA